jgi:CDGSH-type Zn-finger protein/uncharacterized Fe-S cluster protein YjdI
MDEATELHRYEGRDGVVTYEAKRCIHAAECVHGLPAVFDSTAKPWVNPDAADADALAAVIHRCPTGALKLERMDGAAEPVPVTNTATVTCDGPTYLRGDLALMADDDIVALRDTRMALCRCGASQNKPLCDGSHRKAGFRHAGAVQASETPPAAVSGGRLAIRARPNGPLILTGPLTVVGADGRTAYAETTFLCRCGASGNKPYCDGTHKKIGFAG